MTHQTLNGKCLPFFDRNQVDDNSAKCCVMLKEFIDESIALDG